MTTSPYSALTGVLIVSISSSDNADNRYAGVWFNLCWWLVIGFLFQLGNGSSSDIAESADQTYLY